MFIRQFPSTYLYVGLSSLYLKVAKSAWKYHKLQSSAKLFPQIGFMGILNMWFLITCRTTWHQKTCILIFSGFDQKSEFSYQPSTPGWTSMVRWWNPVLLHVPLSIAYRVSHWGGPSRTSNCTSGRGVARRRQVALRLVWKRSLCVECDRRHPGHRDCKWTPGSHDCWNVRSHHAQALLPCLFHDQWQTQTGRDGADVVSSHGRGCNTLQPSRPHQVLYRMWVVLYILPHMLRPSLHRRRQHYPSLSSYHTHYFHS